VSSKRPQPDVLAATGDNRSVSDSEAPGDGPAPSIVVEPPGPISRELLARGEAILYPGLASGLAPFVIESKSGDTITDVDGNVYLDLASASASVPLGACREELIAPAVEAIRRYGNEDSHALANPAMLDLADRLLAIAPGKLSRVDIALNGTEAVETAIRMMRRATGRPVILGFLGGYHGESTTTAVLGAEDGSISAVERGLVPGFIHAPYPNPYRTPFAPAHPGGTGDPTVDFIRDQLLFHLVEPERVAGVVIEPILGSGGCIAPPDSFWSALVELCREYGWLLCADEVKTGFGRGGTMFALERWGVEPDLLCLGKAMGGGVMPIGALLGNERAMGGFDDLSTGSTWSWLPGSVAAALATLDYYEREDVLGNVAELERTALTYLTEIERRFEAVGDVRAVGCFLAIEFVRDPETKERDTELQHAVAKEMLRRGVLADSSTTSLNLQPSLVMSADRLERALTIVSDSIAAVACARAIGRSPPSSKPSSATAP
jgi:4-aminobutyrate aminotransferase-like enzyme